MGQFRNYISEVTFYGLKGTNIGYGITAALDAWTDAGLAFDTDEPRWETGCVFGNSTPDTQAMKNVITRVDNKEAKKLGSRVVEQTMNSGVTSYISGRLGSGQQDDNQFISVRNGYTGHFNGLRIYKAWIMPNAW